MEGGGGGSGEWDLHGAPCLRRSHRKSGNTSRGCRDAQFPGSGGVHRRGAGPREKLWEEWLGFPAMRMVSGRFPLPQKPGLGFDLTEDAFKKHPFEGTRPMARPFHEDGSVAEW